MLATPFRIKLKYTKFERKWKAISGKWFESRVAQFLYTAKYNKIYDKTINKYIEIFYSLSLRLCRFHRTTAAPLPLLLPLSSVIIPLILPLSGITISLLSGGMGVPFLGETNERFPKGSEEVPLPRETESTLPSETETEDVNINISTRFIFASTLIVDFISIIS